MIEVKECQKKPSIASHLGVAWVSDAVTCTIGAVGEAVVVIGDGCPC